MVVREYLREHLPNLSFLVNEEGYEILRVYDLTPYLDYECEISYEEKNFGCEDDGTPIVGTWEILHILPQPTMLDVLRKMKWNSTKTHI